MLVGPEMITFVWHTTCMRSLSCSYNTRRTYDQVRLGKTRNHCPLVGGYNNLHTSLSKSYDHSMVLSVDQVVVPRLDKDFFMDVHLDNGH